MRTICKASLLGVWLLALGLSLGAQEQKQPTAAELSKSETPGKAFTRFFGFQEYEFRSAAEAMPDAAHAEDIRMTAHGLAPAQSVPRRQTPARAPVKPAGIRTTTPTKATPKRI